MLKLSFQLLKINKGVDREDGTSAQGSGPGDETREGSMLGASTDEEENGSVEPLDEPVELRRRRGLTERPVIISETVTTMPRGCRHRSRLIEKEMSKQARIIQDLKLLGASSAIVEQVSIKCDDSRSWKPSHPRISGGSCSSG